MTDALISLGIFVALAGGLLIYSIRKRPGILCPAFRSYALFLLRLSLVIATLHFLFTALGCSVLLGYSFIFVLGLASFGAPLGIGGNLVVLLYLIFGYVFFQWVFWFPDRKSLIPSVTSPANKQEPQSDLIGQIGEVVTPLRPGGTVRVAGQEVQATSEGDFIEKGDQVNVVGASSFTITVRKQNT